MTNSLLLLALAIPSAPVESISILEVRKHQQVFKKLWDEDFVWRFEDLPEKGQVAKHRVPYSGYIYPDRHGGTADVLRKYDRVYNQRYDFPAASWERSDTIGIKEPVNGLLGVLGVKRTPDWHGHCNGWTAASIRHAEPQRSVNSRGVVFSPADIKALLAEVYMYNDTEMLTGLNHKINAGTFHALLANWIGRESHPLGMEKDPGKEKWNYPLYAYASSYGKHSAREIEVNTNVVYAEDSADEYDESPRISSVLFFHYMLRLNSRGDIAGGYFFPDSTQIDMLWVPLHPKQPGEPGNEAGNPHVDVDTVLALWRRSVSSETRAEWVNIDSPREQPATSIATRPPAPSPRAPRPATQPATQPTQEPIEPAQPAQPAAAGPVEQLVPTPASQPQATPAAASPDDDGADRRGLRWLD